MFRGNYVDNVDSTRFYPSKHLLTMCVLKTFALESQFQHFLTINDKMAYCNNLQQKRHLQGKRGNGLVSNCKTNRCVLLILSSYSAKFGESKANALR